MRGSDLHDRIVAPLRTFALLPAEDMALYVLDVRSNCGRYGYSSRSGDQYVVPSWGST